MDIKQKLKEEGFMHVYEWKDEPDTEYPYHEHQDKVSIYVTRGYIKFYFQGFEKMINIGERFNVPPKQKHTATVGDEGCEYVIGEMIKGDS